MSLPRAAAANLTAGSTLVRMVENDYGPSLEVYDAPVPAVGSVRATGSLREVVPQARAASRTDLAATMKLAPGDIATVGPSGKIIGIWKGGWAREVVPVPVTMMSNGDETALALLSTDGVPLRSGNYTLKFTMNRERWREDGAPNPETELPTGVIDHDARLVTSAFRSAVFSLPFALPLTAR